MGVFSDKTIKTRVMKVIEGKIAEAQKTFESKREEEEAARVTAHETVDKTHDAAIEAHADTLVNSILGPLL